MSVSPMLSSAMETGGQTRGEPRVIVRQLSKSDLRDVQRVHRGAYPELESWNAQQFANQLDLFPEGQLCVEVDGRVVATSNSLIVTLDDLTGSHCYEDVCQDGMIRTHDPDGDTLYGIGRRYQVTIGQLRADNNLGKKSTLRPGQKLIVNPPRSN